MHANRLATSFSAQISCRSDARLAGQNLWSSSELLNTKPSALRGNGVLCIVSPLHWPRALPQCNPLMLHISFDLATLNGHSQLLTIWLFHVEQLGLTWTTATWNGSQAKQLPATIPGRCIHDWLSELTNLIKPKHLTRQKHGGNIQCYTMFRFQRFYSFMVMLRSCHVIHLPLGFHPSIQKCQVSGAPRSATCNGNPSKPVSSCTCANIDVRGVHWMRVYIYIYVYMCMYIFILYICV